MAVRRNAGDRGRADEGEGTTMSDAVIRTENLTEFYGKQRGVLEGSLQVQHGDVHKREKA